MGWGMGGDRRRCQYSLLHIPLRIEMRVLTLVKGCEAIVDVDRIAHDLLSEQRHRSAWPDSLLRVRRLYRSSASSPRTTHDDEDDGSQVQ